MMEMTDISEKELMEGVDTSNGVPLNCDVTNNGEEMDEDDFDDEEKGHSLLHRDGRSCSSIDDMHQLRRKDYGKKRKRQVHKDPSCFSCMILWNKHWFGPDDVPWMCYPRGIENEEMACEWTWQMWLLVALGFLPVLLWIVIAHAITSYRQGIAIRKLMEVLATAIVFVLPYLGNPFLHVHHWYYGWLVALHCNLDTWWSRLCRNVFFGIYLNGIAIFGRDPILTCSITFYQSQNQACPYLGQNVTENYTLVNLKHDIGLDFAAQGGCNATNYSGHN